MRAWLCGPFGTQLLQGLGGLDQMCGFNTTVRTECAGMPNLHG
jgi:hypothetical protein